MNISVSKSARARRSELDEYLQLPVENVKDPLKWWVNNQQVYPNLFRMALDYLSIPGEFLLGRRITWVVVNLMNSNINSC